MNYFLFLYSIILTFLFGVCGSGFIVVYRRLKNRRDLWIAVMFLIFTCDNLLISMREMFPDFQRYYNELFSSVSIAGNIITLSMIFSYRMIVAYAFDRVPSKREWLCQILLAVPLLTTTVLSHRLAARLIYLTLIQFCMASILIFGFRGLEEKKPSMSLSSYRLWMFLLVMSTVTHVLGAVENFSNAVGHQWISEDIPRIVGFELFGLFCAGTAAWYLLKYLSKSPSGVSDNELFDLFVHHYRLTPREAELLPLLLEGVQNSEISDRLCISLNTVKVHTHNIYQKIGIERKAQLPAKYQEFSASHSQN